MTEYENKEQTKMKTANVYEYARNILFVREDKPGSFRTVYQKSRDYGKSEETSPFVVTGVLPIRMTAAEAQADLDAYAAVRKWPLYSPGETKPPETDLPADPELTEPVEAYPEEDEPIEDEFPVKDLAEKESELLESDTQEEAEATEESADQSTCDQLPAGQLPEDQRPCDWDSASGNDEEEHADSVPSGKRVSLRDEEFDSIIDSCDSSLNRALRIAIDAKQGFALSVKLAFVPQGGAFRIKHEIGYQFDPIKTKDKGELFEDLQFALDNQGNPVIPFDREHQISFSEAERLKVTTDQNGLVESVETPEEPLYPCDNIDCPLYTGFNGIENGCSFCGNVDAPLDDDLRGSIIEAATSLGCTRDCIVQICKQSIYREGELAVEEEEPSTFALLDDEVEQMPLTAPCNAAGCMFFDADVDGNCAFDPTGEYYGAPGGYPADEDDIVDAVKGFDCCHPRVQSKYQELRENGALYD